MAARARAAPMRWTLLELVDTEATSGSRSDRVHAVDLLRAHGHGRHLLVIVMRLLRGSATVDGDDVREGFDDLAAGRMVPLTDDLLAEIAATKVTKRSRSTST